MPHPTVMDAGAPLTRTDLISAWDSLGVREGDVLLVHASLSAFGLVEYGAVDIVDSLRAVVGQAGTIVVPTFTPRISDPDPLVAGPPSAAVQARRDAVPVFGLDTPSQMGAVAEVVRTMKDALRTAHPQVSVSCHGPAATEITREQSLGYAVGAQSPFAAVRRLRGRILLLGVGHNRNTFLHHAESLSPVHRRKLRRFPMVIDGERVWLEVPDVADDLDTLFPRIGSEYEELGTSRVAVVGKAQCRLMDADSLVRFATSRFDSLAQH